MIDGIDVRQIDPADVRKNIGVMLQDSWLFSGTIRENIQMGYSEYDDEHVLEICKVAGVDDFVGSHPKGYDLEVKERGVGLSGGQKQTINLARSLLHKPAILLLDEPTSSMDQGTEQKVIVTAGILCTQNYAYSDSQKSNIGYGGQSFCNGKWKHNNRPDPRTTGVKKGL